MCRVLAYIGPERPIESLLLEPENSLINQSLDPELYPHLHLAGWGFGVWADHNVAKLSLLNERANRFRGRCVN